MKKPWLVWHKHSEKKKNSDEITKLYSVETTISFDNKLSLKKNLAKFISFFVNHLFIKHVVVVIVK